MNETNTVDLGNTLKVPMPSGFILTIREQNGEDDDVLSKVTDNNNTESLHNFLAGIIIENSQLEKGKYTTANDIKKWKLKDKYYLALKSRLHSLGPDITFDNPCKAKGCTHKTSYEEDLSKFDQDLSQPIKKRGDEGYDEGLITTYPNKQETHRIITLASKKVIRYKYIDGIGENKVLEVSEDKLTKNIELRARSIELQKQAGSKEEWQKIENFKMFTAREMKEIRIDIKKNDGKFEMFSDLKCGKCNNVVTVPLIAFSNFFFPEDN